VRRNIHYSFVAADIDGFIVARNIGGEVIHTEMLQKRFFRKPNLCDRNEKKRK
jgi:hypothetical protein